MVRGLDVFRRRFAGLEDRYVLIGGTAVDIAMDDAGLRFRATKDLDIELHVESLDVEFARPASLQLRETSSPTIVGHNK